MAKKTVKKKAPAKKAAKKAAPAKKAASAKKKAAPAVKKETKKKEVKKKEAKKKPAKRTRRAAKEIRLKAYWGVFNQSLRRVALFEFNERKLADKKAQDLTKGGKSPHFVQPVKEVIDA